MNNYFEILFFVFFGALIVSTISPAIYLRYSPRRTKAGRRRILIYRPVLMVLFLILMGVSAAGWQDKNYENALSADSLKTNTSDYSKSIYPIYNNRYDLAEVLDDNMISLNIKGQPTPVILIGLEKFKSQVSASQQSCYSRITESKLQSYLKNGGIRLEGDDALADKAKDGTLLRYALIDAENINRKMIATGYAAVSSDYAGFKYMHDFLSLQKKAKENKLGLWSGKICAEERAVASNNSSHKQPDYDERKHEPAKKNEKPRDDTRGSGSSGGNGRDDTCGGLLIIGPVLNDLLGGC